MSLPYFPMYPTDFEADTSHLTLVEDGAFNRLLRLCWMTPGCSLPDDDAWIMRRMRCFSDEDCSVLASVICEFFVRENGRVSNAKLTRIFESSNEAHQKRVSAGAKGGKAKTRKTKDTAPSNAVAKPKQPEPEPEPLEEKGKPSSSQEVEDYDLFLLAHPKAVDSDAGHGFFEELVSGGVDPKQIIEAARSYAATVKNWSGEGKVQQSDNFLDPERGKWRQFIPKQAAPVATKAERMEFWAGKINSDVFVPPNAINAGMAREIISAGLVTPEKMKERGITS